MTISYQGGRRLQGLSTDESSASVLSASDYTSSNFTTVGSTVAITSNSVVFSSTPTNADNGQYMQINPLAESDTWSLNFKVNNSSGNTFDNVFLGLSSGSSAWHTSGQKEIKLQTQGTGYMRFTLTTRSSGSNSQTASSNNSYSYGTDYYCTLSSDGTDITFKVWTNSGRTGTASITLTRTSSGLGTMNYIQHRSRNSGDSNTWTGTVSEIEATTKPTITVTGVKPTNVQVGSRFEETDTRKIFNYGGAGTIALDGTPQSNSGTTATSLSKSITVGNHSNKALIALVTQQSGSTTSVKVGSNSFTNMIKTNGAADGNGSQRTEIWYLLNSGITNNASNQVDWVGSAGSRVSIGVYSLYNVNQGGGADTFVASEAYNTSSSYSNQPNGVVNSVDSGDFILDVLSANTATQPTDTLTEGYNILISANRYAVSQYNASPSTNNNMFYSNIQAAEWAWSGARIKQSTNAWSELA